MSEPDLLQLSHALKIRTHAGSKQVFDPVRKRWVALAQEELVRQLLIVYLHSTHGFPYSRMSVERQITVHGMERRYDLVLFDRSASPLMLIECKAPPVPVSQKTMDQIARYNITLQVPYLLVTNGVTTLCCKIDFAKQSWSLLPGIPELQ